MALRYSRKATACCRNRLCAQPQPADATPALQDYIKHAKKLLEDFADVLNTPAAPAASADANGSIFALPAATSAPLFALPPPAGLAPAASAPQAGGAFGLPAASAAPAPFAAFNWAPAPGGASSAPAPAAAVPGGGFGGFGAGFGALGAQSAATLLSNGGGGAPSGGGAFGFGAPAAGAFAGFVAPPAHQGGGPGVTGAAGGDADDDEAAPKQFVPEVRVDDAGAAILYKNRAKVYVQGSDKVRRCVSGTATTRRYILQCSLVRMDTVQQCSRQLMSAQRETRPLLERPLRTCTLHIAAKAVPKMRLPVPQHVPHHCMSWAAGLDGGGPGLLTVRQPRCMLWKTLRHYSCSGLQPWPPDPYVSGRPGRRRGRAC